MEPSALARCADATKDTSQSLSRYQQARNAFKQRSSAEGGERFGLGALAGEAVGAGRGEAITLCPVVVVRGKEGSQPERVQFRFRTPLNLNRTESPVLLGSGSGSGKCENRTESPVLGPEKYALNRTEPDFGNTINTAGMCGGGHLAQARVYGHRETENGTPWM